MREVYGHIVAREKTSPEIPIQDEVQDMCRSNECGTVLKHKADGVRVHPFSLQLKERSQSFVHENQIAGNAGVHLEPCRASGCDYGQIYCERQPSASRTRWTGMERSPLVSLASDD
jgi:hypothetical protein